MEIQQMLGFLLNTSGRLAKRSLDNTLNKYNITTSQWAVLKLLHSKKQLTQTEVSKELLSDKATAGDVISRLCEKNYLEKLSDKNDKRIFVVRLTPSAEKLITELEGMATVVSKKALEGLTDNEIQILNKALNQIISNLSEE